MRTVFFCPPVTKVWLWAADCHSVCSPVWKQRCSEVRSFQHPRYFYMKGFRYIHSRVAEVWGHLIWTDRDLFSASVSRPMPNKPSGHPPWQEAPLELQRLPRIAPASFQCLKTLPGRICCLSTSSQGICSQVQFESGQEPHECLHPGSFFSAGEAIACYVPLSLIRAQLVQLVLGLVPGGMVWGLGGCWYGMAAKPQADLQSRGGEVALLTRV